MENRHSNIAFSRYKDYEHLESNDFSKEKQKIWDFAKKNFHVTHKRITDKELSEFVKIYISHHAYKETKNLSRGNHFYTTYHIVNSQINIFDRKKTLYIDKDNKIVILESFDIDKFDSPITEDVLKEAEEKESNYCGLDDTLKGRTDEWLSKYDSWLGKR